MTTATYRCATDPDTERWSCCGEPTSGGTCVCQRQRNARMKTTKSTSARTTSAPPSPWTRAIAAARGQDPDQAERQAHQARHARQATFEADRKARLEAAKNRPSPPPRPWSMALAKERGAA